MRPLTLLNNDYKILAKALDNRLREVLPNLINEDQTGFIKGRKISHNVRKSLDIIDYLSKKKLPALILSIDMEKCFDRLEHNALIESLKYFNFGDRFVRWVRLFYTNFQICTQNFGELSTFWIKGRGLNQGCPLSPGLYLLTAEIMANKLRNDRKIKGVEVGGVEYLISQFADDTDLYLTYDQTTLSTVLHVLTDIETNTGLRISYEKTTIYRIGSLAGTQAKLYTARCINWSNEFINTLGVDLFNDPDLRKVNITQIINKMETVSKMWYYRNMTLTGKVLIVNSLMASLFVYKMQVLPPIEESHINRIEEVIENFLWRGTKSKIPLKVLQCAKEDRGLGLVNIRAKHKALLFNWINDTLQHAKIENLAICFLGEQVKEGQIWKYNCNGVDSKRFFPGNSFWHQILHAWHEYSFYNPQSGNKVGKQIVWYNSMVKINGKVLHTNRKNGSLCTIGQLWDENRFKTFATVQRECNFNRPWYYYRSLISAIPDTWKFLLKTPDLVDSQMEKFEMVNGASSVSQQIYPDLIKTDVIMLQVCKFGSITAMG